MKALAFIDNGSDTTLLIKRFAVNHNITSRPSSLTINTVNGTKVMSADQANVTLLSLNNGERVEVTEALTIADLPMRAVEPIGELATRWAHLRNVCFKKYEPPEVDLLIGCDVLEAHWVMDQRPGGRKEPYAAHTMFGWTLFGRPHATNRFVETFGSNFGYALLVDLFGRNSGLRTKEQTALETQDLQSPGKETVSLENIHQSYEFRLI
ncbi:unnamed protein product [Echinostoma caproni]|uniref:DUF1758 domain-containing protein n=1 Tax=Echinostoma caproni TaxID=27848 RepID=A0A183B4F7_9TREM|nr:unnamed protein product [Echinostoma caproni]